jgi:hypothetical protein
MKGRTVGKRLDWLKLPPVKATSPDDDRQFGFDPDFLVFGQTGDEMVEREVLFEFEPDDPRLSAGSAPRRGS